MRLNLLKTAPIGTIASRSRLWRIALVLSIGLHGLLLGLPLPERSANDETSAEQEAETLEPVAIRPTVPPVPQSVPQPKPPIAAPPRLALKAAPPSAQRPTVREAVQQPIVRPTPQPVPAPAIPAPTIVPSPSPVPAPVQTPVAVSPSPVASPTPSPEISPSPSPSPDAFAANFPHFENAQAGCYGLETCHLIEGEASFREVGQTMMAQLEAKGYRVRLRDDLEDDTGRKVYEVSKDEETQYLSVLSVLELGRTVYVLADEPVTIADLQ